MHNVAEFMEECLHFIEIHKRVFAFLSRFLEVADHSCDWQHHLIIQDCPLDQRESSSMTILAIPRIEIEIELTYLVLELVIINSVRLDFRMPSMSCLVLSKRHWEQMLVNGEGLLDHMLHREVLFDGFFIYFEFSLFHQIVEVTVVPGLQGWVFFFGVCTLQSH